MSNVKFLFSINTGRCGSDYLAKIFSKIDDCDSKHEAIPVGNGQEMWDFNCANESGMRKLSDTKFKGILGGDKSRVYVDTSHLFIKGFGWYATDYIDEEEIGVIVLKRNKALVVNSFYRIGSSILMHMGKKWLLSPCRSNPIIPPPRISCLSSVLSYYMAWYLKRIYSRINKVLLKLSFSVKEPIFLNNYELECLNWYVDETYALAEKFKVKFPKIKFYEVDIQQLNDLDEVKKVLDFYELPYSQAINDVVGVRSNLK